MTYQLFILVCKYNNLIIIQSNVSLRVAITKKQNSQLTTQTGALRNPYTRYKSAITNKQIHSVVRFRESKGKSSWVL